VSQESPEPIVVNDKRRIDPETGQLRDRTAAEEEGELLDDLTQVAAKEAELLADLQRVTAEYANYRKRVDRDRVLVIESAVAGVLESLLPLLDSVELARQHGDLEGAFKGVGEGLEQVAEKLGLERFGSKGEVFDPAVHHALVHTPEDPEVTETVVAEVLQPGWRLASGRVLRPAGVAVSDPVSPAEQEEPSTQE
jgi:molecular chaperone GrpE